MHRNLVITLWMAAATPAFALAASQPPADSARAHPASSAHANAVAGQTDAARIEACTNATNTLIDDLEKGSYEAATSGFDSTMRAKLGAARLGEVWQQVGGQAGKLQTRGMAQNMMYQGHAIITLPLHFQNANLNAQVACDADGRIAGFFLRPGATPSGSTSSSGD